MIGFPCEKVVINITFYELLKHNFCGLEIDIDIA